jgi:hypothetical protein
MVLILRHFRKIQRFLIIISESTAETPSEREKRIFRAEAAEWRREK